MNNKIVYAGQSFLDKAIELTGSVENAFEMALLNNVSITGSIEIGTELKSSPVTKKAIVAFFDEKVRPATAPAVNETANDLDYQFPMGFPISL